MKVGDKVIVTGNKDNEDFYKIGQRGVIERLNSNDCVVDFGHQERWFVSENDLRLEDPVKGDMVNYVFDIAFSVDIDANAKWENLPSDFLRAKLLSRIAALDDTEFLEAIGNPTEVFSYTEPEVD